MKVKRLVSICLAVGLTFAFSVTAFAATPPNTTVTTATAKVSPLFPSQHPVLYGYLGLAWVTAQPSLLIRQYPNSSATPVGTLNYGEQVNITFTTTDNWAYMGGGWCSGYYLTTVHGDIY
jgi:hypothetical protein